MSDEISEFCEFMQNLM